MLKPLALVLTILGFARSVNCAEDRKAPEFVTDVVFNVPAYTFSAADAPKLKPLPKTANGEERYDAIEFLNGWSLTESTGKLAVYLPAAEALVLTTSVEEKEFVERMLEPCCPQGNVKILKFTVSAWTYLDDAVSLVNKQATRFEELQKTAGDTLRPLDARVLSTPSGTPAESAQVLSSELEPGGFAAGKESSSLKSPGSIVRIEPSIGPDGSTVDFQLEYRARIPQPNAQDVCLAHVTNGTIAADTNQVVHDYLLPPLEGQEPKKVRRCAIVVSVSIPSPDPKIDADTLAKRKKRLIEEALQGLPVK